MTAVSQTTPLHMYSIRPKVSPTPLLDISYKPHDRVPSLASHTFVHQVSTTLLAYAATILGVRSIQLAQQGNRLEMDANNQASETAREEGMAAKKMALKKERAVTPWSFMTSLTVAIMALTTIVTAALAIATGGGALAGSLALVGGILSLTNYLLEVTGGWQKLALSFEEGEEKTRATIMWMQISITVISMVLVALGALFGGGIPPLKEAMGSAGMHSTAIANGAGAVIYVGHGVSQKELYDRIAEVKKTDRTLLLLKQTRDNIIERIREGGEYEQELWKSLKICQKLEHQFNQELFRR